MTALSIILESDVIMDGIKAFQTDPNKICIASCEDTLSSPTHTDEMRCHCHSICDIGGIINPPCGRSDGLCDFWAVLVCVLIRREECVRWAIDQFGEL